MRKLDRLLEDLPDTEAELLRDALASRDVEHRQLARLLKAEGHDISEAAVRNWRGNP